jgi:aspartyl-tRNA(Asn)/glutamyl-tRNA(Gln) amidotransferase subunit A
MLDILSEQSKSLHATSFPEEIGEDHSLRIGIATNFEADEEIRSAFHDVLKTIRDFGYPASNMAVPFVDLNKGIDTIEEDRKAIAKQLFSDIDILVLPTTTTVVPGIQDANQNPQALSPQNTAFANYYGLPAVSIPCGLDSHGLPVGLQIISRPWNEKDVLSLAHQFEVHKPFQEKLLNAFAATAQ